MYSYDIYSVLHIPWVFIEIAAHNIALHCTRSSE